MKKKIMISGVQPTGELHIGNYFGAMKQFVDLQNSGKYDSYVFLADYHALNTVQDKAKMQQNSFNVICAYLAIGLDPKKTTLFKQSFIPELPELAWIFGTQTTMPYLMRAHAFKDAEAKNKEISVGTFTYPILMSADILMSDADVVPVGKDQRQHVEMAREIGDKFNRIYKAKIFTSPQELILEEVETIPGIDGQKMSKSYNNVISLFGKEEDIKKSIMSIQTDSRLPEEKKDAEEILIYRLYKLVANKKDAETMKKQFAEGKLSYGDAKKELLRAFLEYFEPMRKKYFELQKNKSKVLKILEKGSKKMKKKAEAKMKQIKEKTGLL